MDLVGVQWILIQSLTAYEATSAQLMYYYCSENLPIYSIESPLPVLFDMFPFVAFYFDFSFKRSVMAESTRQSQGSTHG